MSLFDSHTHLYFKDTYDSPEETVKRAIDDGVRYMVFPGVNADTIQPIRELHSKFPENTYMAIGLHPTDVEPGKWKEELDIIFDELRAHRDEYVAIGETGIDLHWDATYLDLQQQAFEKQIQLALELNLPIIIHSRDAFPQTYEVLQSSATTPAMVFHSYSGDPAETEKILSMFPGAYFGINGIVTFKNAKIKDVLPVVPDNQLLIETDAPYLAPVPKRGQTNESAFLVHTAKFIAEQKGLSFEKLADLTTSNAKRFFNIPQ